MIWFALASEVTVPNTYLQFSLLATAGATEMQVLTTQSVVFPWGLLEI